MKLLNLSLLNFKGIKKFDLAADGADVIVSADNGVGKTTLADAFCFALWGKSADGREPEGKSGFRIKPLGKDGESLHNIESTVVLTLALDDGSALVLERTFFESWQTIRGGNKKEFGGHKQKFTCDSVPKSATQFDQIVASLCPGGKSELLRILCQATAFNETLTWQERRAYLVELTGDISDADVIASSDALKPLTAVLGKRTVEDCREVLKADRKKAQERLRDIPARIDELTRGLGE